MFHDLAHRIENGQAGVLENAPGLNAAMLRKGVRKHAERQAGFRVEDANEAAASLLGLSVDALRGSTFSQHFADRSNVELTESLLNATLSDEGGQVTLRTSRTRKSVIVHPTVFRAGGQRVLLCRIGTETGAAAVPDALTNQALDPFGKIPEFKFCAAKVERATVADAAE